MFVISAIVYAIGGLAFAVLGSGEVQQWGKNIDDFIVDLPGTDKGMNNAAYMAGTVEQKEVKKRKLSLRRKMSSSPLPNY